MQKQSQDINRQDLSLSDNVDSSLRDNDMLCGNNNLQDHDTPTTSLKKVRGFLFTDTNVTYANMDSPVGNLTIIASPDALHAILWDKNLQNLKYQLAIENLKHSQDNPILIETKKQLNEYFEGRRKVFDLPIKPDGTDFQIRVWAQLSKIPYATTISYKTQAERIGDKNKARAVGMANGKNPISIIIPCHRVVGSNGNLVGFAGGLDKKEYLLQLEKKFL